MQIGLSDEPYDVLRYHHREFIPHNQTREDWNFLKEDHFPDPDEWLSNMKARPVTTLNKINENMLKLRHDERKEFQVGHNYLGYYNDW